MSNKKPTITVYSVERDSFWSGKSRDWRLFKREAKTHGNDHVRAREYPSRSSISILGASKAHGLPELAHAATRERLEAAVAYAEKNLADAKSELASLPPLESLETVETKLPT